MESTLFPSHDILPLGLNWHENIDPYFANAVSKEVEACAHLFRDQFDQEEQKLLLLASRNLRRHSTKWPHIRPGRAGEHRQINAKNSPIYVCLDPDPGSEAEPSQDTVSVERFVRLLILKHVLGHISLSKSQLKAAEIICRRLRFSVKSDPNDVFYGWSSSRYVDLTNQLSPLIVSRDWTELKTRTDTLSTNQDYGRNLQIRLKDLSTLVDLIIHQLPRKKALRGDNRPAVIKILSKPPFMSAPIDTNAPSQGPSGTIVSLNPDIRAPIQKERPLRALAVRGASIRLNGLWAYQDDQALIDAEARACMSWLLKRQPATQAENIARHLWVLSGVSLFQFDNLLVSFTGPLPNIDPNPHLDIKINGDRIEITYDLIAADHFESPPPNTAGAFHPTQQTITRHIGVHAPELDFTCLEQLQKIQSKSDPLLKGVINAKKSINDAIRENVCDHFTNDHFRGSFFLKLFAQTQDLPLVQMVSADAAGASTAALHYIALPQSYIQAKVDAATIALYPGLIFPIELSNTLPLVGAPTSALDLSRLHDMAKRLEANMYTAISSSQPVQKGLLATHKALADRLGVLLLLVTANRNQADFADMTLDQICLDLGFIIFHDKGSNPAIFRRVAALPAFVIQETLNYLYHLRKMADFFRRHKDIDTQDAAQHLREVASGEKPLLFTLCTKNDKQLERSILHFDKWNGREIIRSHLGQNIPGDICRHVFGSYPRAHLPFPTALIEAQMGHQIGYDWLGNESVIDIPGFVREISPHLNAFLELCGFDTSSKPTTPINIEDYQRATPDWRELGQKTNEVYRQDGDRVRNMTKVPNRRYQGTLKQRITTLIVELLEINNIGEIPKGYVLTENTAKLLYNQVLSSTPGSPYSLYCAANYLRRYLKSLKAYHQWKLHLPPAIFWDIKQPIRVTKYHITAHKNLVLLRKSITDRWRSPKSKDQLSYGDIGLTIFIFGGADSIEETYLILENAQQYQVSPSCDALIIPIPITGKSGQIAWESRTITGIAMAALIGWIATDHKLNGIKRFEKSITSALPSEWKCTIHELETLIQLGRRIELPPILADMESGKLIARALPATRLSHYLVNSGENSPIDIELLIKDRVKSALASKNEPIDRNFTNSFKALLTLIREDKKNRLRDRIAIRQFLNSDDQYQLIRLLGEWAICLCGDEANWQIGGPLSRNTIINYLTLARSVLSPALLGLDISAFDGDELEALIADQLSDFEQLESDKPFVISRMFSEIAEICEIPKLLLPYSKNKKGLKLCIDANIITPMESLYAQNQLRTWAGSTFVSARTACALNEAAELTSLGNEQGTRKSEGAYLMQRDVTDIEDKIAIFIRSNHYRSPKSESGRRRLIFDKDQMKTSIPIDHNAKRTDLVFQNIQSSNLGFDPFSAISLALKIASSDKSAVPHRQRHFKASDSADVFTREKSFVEKIHYVSKIIVSIGHSSYRTTLNHYTHTAHHVMAMEYSPRMDSLSSTVISNLIGGEILNLPQKLSTSKKRGEPYESCLFRLVGFSPSTFVYDKPLVQATPKKLLSKGFSLIDAIDFLHSLFAYKYISPEHAKNLPEAYRLKLLEGVCKAQRIANINLISEQRITALIDKPSTGLLEGTNNRRLIDKIAFDIWRKKAKHLPQDLDNIHAATSEIYWRGAGLNITKRNISWAFIDDTDAKCASQALESIGLPLSLTQSPNGKWLIQEKGMGQEISARTIQALLLSALALAITTRKNI
jgi:hypothetical protein